MKKLFKFFSITGILSILLVFNVLAEGKWVSLSGDPQGKKGPWGYDTYSSKDGYMPWNQKGLKEINGQNWYFSENNKTVKGGDKNTKYAQLYEGANQYKTINGKVWQIHSDGKANIANGWSTTFTGSDEQGIGYCYWQYYSYGAGPVKNAWIDENGTGSSPNKKFTSDKYCYRTDSAGRTYKEGLIITVDGKSYKVGAGGKCTLQSNKQDQEGFFPWDIQKKAGWVSGSKTTSDGTPIPYLYDTNGKVLKNQWTDKYGQKYNNSYEKGYTEYYSTSDGSMAINTSIKDSKTLKNYIFDETGKCIKVGDYKSNDKKEDKKEDKKQKETPKQDGNSADLNTKPDNGFPKNPREGWNELGNGDWGLYYTGHGWYKNHWDNGSGNWYYLNSKGVMLRNCYVYPADISGSTLTLDESKAVKDSTGKAIKYYFKNDGEWTITNIIAGEFNLDDMPPAQALSFLTKQEKKDIKNKKDEDVENEIAIPIEIYTKDQFYKGKFSTGQMSENEYLTNGYYIYNKGNGKYTLYKTNDTIGKTSKAIKSNTTLAKITDYLDDNDIEKSAEIKAKEGSSSSKDKSSSKTSKKITVTIKSGYKTKDKQSVSIDYEGSYTLPTFEEMNWTEKPKYTFSHWAIGSKKYNPGDTIDNIKSKKTITAKWKKN